MFSNDSAQATLSLNPYYSMTPKWIALAGMSGSDCRASSSRWFVATKPVMCEWLILILVVVK